MKTDEAEHKDGLDEVNAVILTSGSHARFSDTDKVIPKINSELKIL